MSERKKKSNWAEWRAAHPEYKRPPYKRRSRKKQLTAKGLAVIQRLHKISREPNGGLLQALWLAPDKSTQKEIIKNADHKTKSAHRSVDHA